MSQFMMLLVEDDPLQREIFADILKEGLRSWNARRLRLPSSSLQHQGSNSRSCRRSESGRAYAWLRGGGVRLQDAFANEFRADLGNGTPHATARFQRKRFLPHLLTAVRAGWIARRLKTCFCFVLRCVSIWSFRTSAAQFLGPAFAFFSPCQIA